MIRVESWGNVCASILQDSEIPELGSFRLPSMNYTDIAYLCDVEITGRKTRRLPYSDCEWVRIRITWIHEDEPNTHSFGWMVV